MLSERKSRGSGFWVTLVLFNLFIVAVLGVLLRSKILFPIEICDFKYLLNAHSHFAFGGWISLTIIVLLVYEILPPGMSEKSIYQWLFGSAFINAWGMLLSFPFQGYGFYSILFSALFTLTTYVFSWVFIRDIWKARGGKAVRLLCIGALLSLVFSSAGPIALAYLASSKSVDVLLNRDAVYTYLHLQYNGFFSLAVFALLFHRFGETSGKKFQLIALRFAVAISLSILPSLFLTYLWHYPNIYVRLLALTGCVFVILSLAFLVLVLSNLKGSLSASPALIKNLVLVSMLAFCMKSLMQCGVVIPAVGDLIFANRPIIIGYLHLIMLGFISLYLMAHFCTMGLLDVGSRFTKYSVMCFLFAVIVNETILMVQGICAFFMMGSPKYQWYLWYAAILLSVSTLLIYISRLKTKDLPVK